MAEKAFLENSFRGALMLEKKFCLTAFCEKFLGLAVLVQKIEQMSGNVSHGTIKKIIEKKLKKT